MLAVVAALHDGLTVEPVHGAGGELVGWQVSLVIPDQAVERDAADADSSA